MANVEPPPARPAEDDYPRTLMEFERRFSTDAACREYLCEMRWHAGFRCPKCGGSRGWATGRAGLRECGACHHQTSATSGTIFEGTRKPLALWFRAMWWVTNQKPGVSALSLQRMLGLRSYQTAWAWLQKLRRAMVRPGRDKLAGEVEVDETFVGGPGSGGGRSIGNKALVGVAVEIRGSAMGRIRMRRVRDSSGESLQGFVQSVVSPGALIVTDGLPSYLGLPALGYRHDRRAKLGSVQTDEPVLPRAHRVASLLKRWLLGTHQGAVSREHLDYYLDEFTFRFNRRNSRSRGKLFQRLLQQAVLADPVPYARLLGKRAKRGHKMLGQPERNG